MVPDVRANCVEQPIVTAGSTSCIKPTGEFACLSRDLLVKIFKDLTLKDKVRVSAVCQDFKTVCEDPALYI
jgi:hypothetical protein